MEGFAILASQPVSRRPNKEMRMALRIFDCRDSRSARCSLKSNPAMGQQRVDKGRLR